MVGLAVAAVLCCGSMLRAAEATATGTWKSTFKMQDGTERTTTFKLKQDGEKLTGTVSGRNNTETEITEGSVKDGTVTFKVVRKFNDREFTTVYTGKLEGDTIKGKSKMGGGDNARERDWEAKREK
jgi:hypothetical protein